MPTKNSSTLPGPAGRLANYWVLDRDEMTYGDWIAAVAVIDPVSGP